MRINELLRHLTLQAQDDDGEGSGIGGGADARKRFVESQVETRFKPRQVREILAKYGDDAAVALESVLEEDNDKIRRFMRRQAELEYDLEQERMKGQTLELEVKKAVEDRDKVKADLDQHLSSIRSAEAEGLLLKKVGGDKVLATRHRGYLKLDGYEIEVDGEGEKARLMLVRDGNRHHYDTVVNDKWYQQYPDAKPSGDNPLGGVPEGGVSRPQHGGTQGVPPGSSEIAKQAAALAKEYAERIRKTTRIPGVNTGVDSNA